jgi:hypothetical protein
MTSTTILRTSKSLERAASPLASFEGSRQGIEERLWQPA